MIEKTALVTGADGGLGVHVTKALLDAGFLVAGLAPKIKQSDFDDPGSRLFPPGWTASKQRSVRPTR